MLIFVNVANLGYTASTGEPSSKQKFRDDFIRRFYSQHTSTIYNDNVYICLEERCLATSTLFGLTSKDNSKSNGTSDVFDDGENVLALLDALQVHLYMFFQIFTILLCCVEYLCGLHSSFRHFVE